MVHTGFKIYDITAQCNNIALQLVSEFLADQRKDAAPQTFQMDSLLREMHEIENRRMHHAPVTGTRRIIIMSM